MAINMIQEASLLLLPSMNLHKNTLQKKEFTDMDANNDGVVTTDEVLTDHKFFSAGDANQDGIITLKEAMSHLEERKAKDLSQGDAPNQAVAQLPKDIIDQLASVRDSEERNLSRAIQKNLQLDTAYLKDLVEVLDEECALQLLA